RNYLLEKAKGDYIIEIDDDAIFKEKDAVLKTANFFNNNLNYSIIAFKIVNFHLMKVNPDEFPFKRFTFHPHDSSAQTTCFIGAGHAFRKEMLNQIGLYRDFYPYGHEEQ